HRLINARHLLLQQRIGRSLLLDLVQTGVVGPFERLERGHHLMHGGARLGMTRDGLGLFHDVSRKMRDRPAARRQTGPGPEPSHPLPLCKRVRPSRYRTGGHGGWMLKLAGVALSAPLSAIALMACSTPERPTMSQ